MGIFKFESKRQDGQKREKVVLYIKDYPPIIVVIAIMAVVGVAIAFIFKAEMMANL